MLIVPQCEVAMALGADQMDNGEWGMFLKVSPEETWNDASLGTLSSLGYSHWVEEFSQTAPDLIAFFKSPVELEKVASITLETLKGPFSVTQPEYVIEAFAKLGHF
jgi:hypothetical protein